MKAERTKAEIASAYQALNPHQVSQLLLKAEYHSNNLNQKQTETKADSAHQVPTPDQAAFPCDHSQQSPSGVGGEIVEGPPATQEGNWNLNKGRSSSNKETTKEAASEHPPRCEKEVTKLGIVKRTLDQPRAHHDKMHYHISQNQGYNVAKDKVGYESDLSLYKQRGKRSNGE
ncbi:hypothetical protein CR513_18848, partial [Mucuna pruriens]